MGYYEEVQAMNQDLDKVFERIKAAKIEVSKKKLLHQMTTIYKVGMLTVKKRIDFLLDVDDEVIIEGDTLRCSQLL